MHNIKSTSDHQAFTKFGIFTFFPSFASHFAFFVGFDVLTLILSKNDVCSFHHIPQAVCKLYLKEILFKRQIHTLQLNFYVLRNFLLIPLLCFCLGKP